MSNIIKKYRKKNNLTQRQLSIKCNLKQSYISQLEHYKAYPSISTIYSLSRALHISPGELIKHFTCYSCPFDNCKNCFNVKL